ncbi:hypothetical protein [Thioalkalivibrio sp. XN8]|uniref:hypothetical protein n=1 Tax=Thioalkalivibrio sp. XN8 TaxID=2712863 RepID=UPI0013EB770A|nr:hypothetical protein [Thioalkalivibrio sp. XN8]NGP53234.1 hypothetical protein [Thioalkalivibrio sp. XN8]
MTRTKDPLEGIVKVVHSGTCPSLSGKSQITYQIGKHPEGTVHLRVVANTGGGFFSPEWVALSDLQKCIDDAPKDRPLSSWTLHPIFRGKSVNTPAFLSAALVHEKWLRILKGKKRGLEVYDPKAFEAKLEKLTGGKAGTASSGRQVAKKKITTKKAPMRQPGAAKKKAMPAKKKKAASV